jgi:pilus assembly protein CpaE
MTTTSLRKIHVLVLRGELTTVSPAVDGAEHIEDLLRVEPRIKTTVAAAAFGQSLRTAQGHHPDVILLDGVFGDPADLVSELDDAMPDTPVVVLLDETDRDRAHACVVAGARACLIRPLQASTLAATVLQVHDKASRRRRHHADRPTGADKVGRLIAVRGAKGGVGATVVASNLAVAIRRLTKQPTALVDGHFFGGDVPVALNLKPARSMIDLTRHLNGLDEDMLRNTLTEHPSGLLVLAAPQDFEDAEAIRPDDYQHVLDAVRTHYAYVVVDCSPAVDQNTLAALDMADVLVLVSTPEIPALKNAARLLQLGARLGYPESKMRLVVNRFDAPGALAPSDFEHYLAHPTSFRIPNDGSVVRALTRGEPLATQRGSRAGTALDRLARVIVANEGWLGEPRPRSGRGLLGLSFRRRSVSPEPLRLQSGAEAA